MRTLKTILFILIGFIIGLDTAKTYYKQHLDNFAARSTPLSDVVLSTEVYSAEEVDALISNNTKIIVGSGTDSLISINTNRVDVDLSKFGQTNINQAVSESSVSFGYGNISGQKGYRYSSWDYANKTITFENIPVGWEVNDVISIINKSKYPNCAIIVSITSNQVEISNWPTDMATNIVADVDNFDRQVAYVEVKPMFGDVDIGQGAFSEGLNNKAIGFGSHVEGVANVAAGQFSHVEGRNNYGQYINHVEGQNNYSSGFWSHVEGRNNTNSATLAHVAGQNVNSTHANSWTWNATGSIYPSKGSGTFAINPTGGANGFYIGTKRIADVIQDGYGTAISTKVSTEIDNKIVESGIPTFTVGTNSIGKIVSATFDSDGDENYGMFKMFLDIGGNLTVETLYGKELPENVGVIEVYSKETLDRILTNIIQRIEILENK